MDLRELVEDELLLGLPLVPRHEDCPQPLPVPIRLEDDTDDADDAEAALPSEASRSGLETVDAEPGDTLADGRPNPFAVLKQLKQGGGSGT